MNVFRAYEIGSIFKKEQSTAIITDSKRIFLVLKGFRESITAVYPKAHIQRCIIHQIRSSTRYVGYKDIKTLMPDLKLVYKAVTEEEAYENLMVFKDKWGKQYPSCVKSWKENWDMVLNQLEIMFADRIKTD